jgi:hypothetical protein
MPEFDREPIEAPAGDPIRGADPIPGAEPRL